MESPGTYPTLQEGFALEVTPRVGGSVDDRAGVVVTLVFANHMRAGHHVRAFVGADWVRPDDGPLVQLVQLDQVTQRRCCVVTVACLESMVQFSGVTMWLSPHELVT